MKGISPFEANGARRIFIHLLFWVCYISYFTLLSTKEESEFAFNLFAELLLLPVKLVIVYFTLYVLIPKFLAKKQYVIFTISSIITLIMGGLVQRTIDYYYLYPIRYSNFIDYFGDFWHGYYIMKSITNINFIVVLTAAIKILKYWYHNEKTNKALEKEKLEAELKFLKAQIHPHFLFNTLNNLYALTLQKSQDAPQVVLKLSGLMNYMLYSTKDKLVPLSKEIESIHNYIALEKIRYGNSLDIAFDVSGEVSTSYIAPLLLLPFIENSFKHGVSDEVDNKWITINLHILHSVLTFKVENSRSPQLNSFNKEQAYKGGIGLKNVQRRLELIYPAKHELHIFDDTDSYLIILKIHLEN